MQRMTWSRLLPLLGMLLLICLPASPAAAQTPQPPSEDDVNAVARELFCPICENTPLDVCPTEACRQWRDLIREMLLEGKSEEQIQQFFVDHYGARVLGAPPAEGINWLAYVLPPVAFLVGVVLLYMGLYTWKRMNAVPAADLSSPQGPPAPEDDEYTARIEAELKKRG